MLCFFKRSSIFSYSKAVLPDDDQQTEVILIKRVGHLQHESRQYFFPTQTPLVSSSFPVSARREATEAFETLF